jgi:hypothetical protein
MSQLIHGIARVNNKQTVSHMHWPCYICNEDIRVAIDNSPVQFTPVACPRCHREYNLHNYLIYNS